MNKEEGRLLLEKKTNTAIEFDESMVENKTSNLINDNHIDYVDTNKSETYSDSDSACVSDYDSLVEK